MRVVCTIFFSLAVSGAAQASSISALPARTEALWPSILSLRDTDATASITAPGQPGSAVSPSIVAMGEPVPAVSQETVAAVGGTGSPPAVRSTELPMVIRGGIAGEAFPDPAPAALARTPAAAEPSPPAGKDAKAKPPAGSADAAAQESSVDPLAASNVTPNN